MRTGCAVPADPGRVVRIVGPDRPSRAERPYRVAALGRELHEVFRVGSIRYDDLVAIDADGNVESPQAFQRSVDSAPGRVQRGRSARETSCAQLPRGLHRG